MISVVLEKDGLGGQVLNCGTGVPTSIVELAMKAIQVSGQALEPQFAASRLGDIRHSLCNVQRSRELLGFRAKVSLEDGLSEMIR